MILVLLFLIFINSQLFSLDIIEKEKNTEKEQRKLEIQKILDNLIMEKGLIALIADYDNSHDDLSFLLIKQIKNKIEDTTGLLKEGLKACLKYNEEIITKNFTTPEIEKLLKIFLTKDRMLNESANYELLMKFNKVTNADSVVVLFQ